MMKRAGAGLQAARWATLAVLVLGVGWSAPLQAQTVPTQEGTVIKNKATATFRDAANNELTAESNEVEVTVGFRAGVDVTAPTDVTVTTGSTNNSVTYTMCMTGNAKDDTQDWFVVALQNSDPAVALNVRFVWNSVTYADVASLNAALLAAKTPAYDDPDTTAEENCIEITVLYDAGAGAAGSSSTLTLTATSGRDALASDSDAVQTTLQLSGSISVTPDDGTQNVYRGTTATYNTLTFTLTNNQSGQDGFALVASLAAADVTAGYTIVSIRCVPDDGAPVAGNSTECLAVSSGGARTVTVVLGVPADAAAGANATVTLTATSQTSILVTDTGQYVTTVIMPVLSMTKAAYGAQDADVGVGAPRPGDPVWYLITITNSGSATASSVVVTDALPAQVTYVSSFASAGTWSFAEVDGVVTATLEGTLGVDASASFWIHVTVK